MRSHGFTLLEMLAAVAIFAVLSVVAFGGLNALIVQYRQGEQSVERLNEIQRVMSLLSQDFIQAQPRGIRGEFHGDPSHAVLAGDDKTHALELTRGGWSNPAGSRRSSLQRVAWTLDGDRLVRLHWVDLDRAPEPEVVVSDLAGGVEAARWRLLDERGEWHETWPPLDWPEGVHDDLPAAIELTLELKDWGTVTRVFIR